MKFKGIKKVSGESKNLRQNCYLQLNIDLDNNELFTNYHCSIGQNSWSVYNDSSIKVIGNITEAMKMSEIESMVERELSICN